MSDKLYTDPLPLHCRQDNSWEEVTVMSLLIYRGEDVDITAKPLGEEV